eukprot:2276559-Amphidinium_carterae.1
MVLERLKAPCWVGKVKCFLLPWLAVGWRLVAGEREDWTAQWHRKVPSEEGRHLQVGGPMQARPRGTNQNRQSC